MHSMVQHPTNTAIYPPNVLRLICLLDGEAYGLTAFEVFYASARVRRV